MCGFLLSAPYWGPDLARKPGTCPDWELNPWPFGLQASAQPTEPHQPGPTTAVLNKIALKLKSIPPLPWGKQEKAHDVIKMLLYGKRWRMD